MASRGPAWLALAGAVGTAALPSRARSRLRRLAVDYGVFLLFAGFAVLGVWLVLNRDAAFIQVLLGRYGLPALLAIFVLEGAMLLYFAPSESLVPVAIGLTLSTDVAPATPTVFALIVGTAVVGATIGQYLLFLLAKRWGRERLLEAPWFRVRDTTLDRFDRWFERWGVLAIPATNTLLFTRGMLTVPAGLAEMDDRQFVALSALGTLVFETALAALTLGLIGVFS